MHYLKQFFAFIFSRQMLAFMAVLLLALVVWFTGPLLSVEGLRPLASVGVRVGFIVLLLAFVILWLLNGPLSLVGVAALCLLVWHAGPLLSLGDTRPLAPTGVRALVIALIVLACALYWLYRLLRAVAEDKDFLARFFRFEKEADAENVAKEELRKVASKLRRADRQLRKLRLGGGLRRLFEGKRYLYELPWYMILGSAGAGKTTVLLNSGQPFPTAHQLDDPSRTMVLQSQRGTMHCDWWFTNEAVLIDTAGRFADSNVAKDKAEWFGFLGLLRRQRTRAPINGAIVALNAANLLQMDEADRIAHAERVRDRLGELREALGIRFPVYVVITKMDVLGGFEEYFRSLTSEGRTQAWGFTLPSRDTKSALQVGAPDVAGHPEALHERVARELTLLKDRMAAGLRPRLTEEFDIGRRRRLSALPDEFAGLAALLPRMIGEIFLDSRFDDTQSHNTLRGVFLTSGAQSEVDLPADRNTLLQRLRSTLDLSPFEAARAPAEVPAGDGTAPAAVPARPALVETPPTRGQASFFLQDLFTRFVIPEAHLVRPNLRWEFRFRLLRLLGHSLVLVIGLWLSGAIVLSFGNNEQYLASVAQRARVLTDQVRTLVASFQSTAIPDVLHAARALADHSGLDLAHPPASYRYGLYAAPPVVDASTQTYAQLQEHLLLPPILQRMESVLAQSLKDQDARTAYETLRAYKLLHDRARYVRDGGAADVKDWVLKDWSRGEGAAAFGASAAMVAHVEALFSGERAVQSASLPNEALVREVRQFLGGSTSTQRVYERAKFAMLPDAPREFTLVRAVGPQAGTVFARAGGLPLEKGVPGLFTYEGYHELFDKRLPEFVDRALQDDAWVMGRVASEHGAAVGRPRSDPLREDIRRQYLDEYALRWEQFLDSIRAVGGGDGAGGNLGFDLAVLRQFAAPDSPLARLARAAARETTLSRPLLARAPADKSLLDKAADTLSQKTQDIGKTFGLRDEARLEKQIVDDRFAALREVVTGQPDANPAPGAGAGTGTGTGANPSAARPGLEALSSLVNEFYTLLVVADTALTAGSLPPGAGEVGARLKLEAGKLPAPFREVLTALATSGADKVLLASTEILRKQAQQQLDRLMGLMAMHVSEPCRRGVEGRYPLAAVAQDASVEDFALVFAAGGAADEFFTRHLAPFVDTGTRPWRYKQPETAHLATVAAEGVAHGTPSATPGPTTAGPTVLGELLKLLAHSGPDLEAFYRARQIRDLFFREAGGRKLSWKVDMTVLELDPTITDLVINIDGQGHRYIHGPLQPFAVQWPGPRGGSMAELIANPRISGATSVAQGSGPWAFFRLLDKGRLIDTATPGRSSVEFSFDGRKALLDISAGSQPNPLNSDLLKGFRCPGRSA